MRLFSSYSVRAFSLGVALLGTGALLAVDASRPALAESSVEMRALYNRLDRLERDMLDVQRQTYQAGGAAQGTASAGFGPDPASAADLSLRLQSVEESLRSLTGRIEELSHELTQTRSAFNRFREDTEFRFQELGSAGGRSLVADGGAPQLTPPSSGAPSAAAASTVGTLGTIPQGALPPAGNDNQDFAAYQPQALGQSYGGIAPATAPSGDAPEEMYDAAINLLKRGQFDAAEADLSNFIQRYPNHNLAGNAQYWLGETFYVRGAYRQAAEAFLAGYTTYASSNKAPDSLLKLGMTLAALGQRDQACATFGELGRRFPSASQAVTQRAALERGRSGC